MYVIVRNDGKFVVPPGNNASYSDKLQDAWVFNTRNEAERNRCPENERVESVRSVLRAGLHYES